MYKPNRIGPYGLFDVVKARETPALTTGILGAVNGSYVYIGSATIPDETAFVKYDVASLAIATDKAMSIGLAVAGSHENSLPIIYSIVASAQFYIEEGLPVGMQLRFGVSTNATITVGLSTQQNLSTVWINLPSKVHSDTGVHQISCQCSVVGGLFGQGAALTTNPKMAWLSIINSDGSTNTVKDLSLSISVHKYLGSLDTLDPPRS